MKRFRKKPTLVLVLVSAAVLWISLHKSGDGFIPEASAQPSISGGGGNDQISVRIRAKAWEEGDWNGDSFDIISFQHGLSRSAIEKEPVFDGFSVIKEIDKASPKLAEAVAEGQVISKLEIELTATYGGIAEPLPYLRYELSNVRATSYNVGGQGEKRPVEQVAFVYEEISVIHTEYDENGLPLGETRFNWPMTKGQ